LPTLQHTIEKEECIPVSAFEPLLAQHDNASTSTSTPLKDNDLGMHVSETLHMHVYRLDLKARIEQNETWIIGVNILKVTI
jgi:hypothetical protein